MVTYHVDRLKMGVNFNFNFNLALTVKVMFKFCTSGPDLAILDGMGDNILRGQIRGWCACTHTDEPAHTQYRKPKLALAKMWFLIHAKLRSQNNGRQDDILYLPNVIKHDVRQLVFSEFIWSLTDQ